jgi:hypothetical protein
VFEIVLWHRGDWVDLQLRRHARVFRSALAKLALLCATGDAVPTPLDAELTVDGTKTPAHRRLATERLAILEDAKKRAAGKEGLGAGAAQRTAEKLENRWARRRV